MTEPNLRAARDVRDNWADVLDAVQHRGEAVVITRNGKRAAELIPFGGRRLPEEFDRRLAESTERLGALLDADSVDAELVGEYRTRAEIFQQAAHWAQQQAFQNVVLVALLAAADECRDKAREYGNTTSKQGKP